MPIAELVVMKGNEEHYDTKFIVLAENVRHHIKEEEGEMFPKVRSLKLDLVELGQKMVARRQSLLQKTAPTVRATANQKRMAVF
ncbi:MAG: hypothetical protein ACOYNL_03275 [Rickettsiales bacterium]